MPYHDLEALGMKNDIWNSEQNADQKSGVTVEPVKIKEEPGSDLSPYGGSFDDKINTEVRQEATSEQHIAKKKRNRGKVIARRTLLPPCGEKCRLKCASRLSEEQISSIRDRFWKLEDIALQREFIVDHSVRICPKFKLESGSTYRKRNLAYYFDVDGKKTRVCKHMFLSTLSVGRNYVATAWKKKTAEGRPTSKTL
ncbi:hypothetical protein C0J52_05504 [Blattella germanica]|nr:hypothetical protein C0J52_05504 [Blattella germanica]